MVEQNPFKFHINMHKGLHFCCKHKNFLCKMLGSWQSWSEVMTLRLHLSLKQQQLSTYSAAGVLYSESWPLINFDKNQAFFLNRPFRTGITQPVLVSPDTPTVERSFRLRCWKGGGSYGYCEERHHQLPPPDVHEGREGEGKAYLSKERWEIQPWIASFLPFRIHETSLLTSVQPSCPRRMGLQGPAKDPH